MTRFHISEYFLNDVDDQPPFYKGLLSYGIAPGGRQTRLILAMFLISVFALLVTPVVVLEDKKAVQSSDIIAKVENGAGAQFKELLTTKFNLMLNATERYSAIVLINGSNVVAKDANGNLIANGVAGKDDTFIIQSAIDHFSSGNAIIYISSGTYYITSTLILSHDGIAIRGAGGSIFGGSARTTLIQDANCNVIECIGTFQNNGEGHHNQISISDLLIKNDGNHTGIGINAGAINGLWIERVGFDKLTGGAIYAREIFNGCVTWCDVHFCGSAANRRASIYFGISGPNSTLIGSNYTVSKNTGIKIAFNLHEVDQYRGLECVMLESSEVFSNWYEGAVLEANKYPTDAYIYGEFVDTQIHNNYITFYNVGQAADATGICLTGWFSSVYDNTITMAGIGIVAESNYPNIHDNIIHECKYDGIVANASIVHGNQFGKITNNWIGFAESIGYNAIYVEDTNNWIIGNNTIIEYTKGITLTNASYCSVQNNRIQNDTTNRSDIGIDEVGTSDNNIISNNQLKSLKYPIIKAGPHTVCRYNQGYATENKGLSTGTGKEQTIAHGLVAVPSKVVVVPTIKGVIVSGVWADAKNIYCSVTRGKPFNWSAEV